MAIPDQDSLSLAQSLESTGRALQGLLGAEMLVYAADRIRSISDPAHDAMADALIARARQMDPKCHLALQRALQSAAARGDWLVLADALATAIDLVPSDHAKAVLLAQRAEVVGYRLGRSDEARSAYIEAAHLSPSLAAAALAAAEDAEARQAGRIMPDAPWPEVVGTRPAFDPLVGAGLPPGGRPHAGLDRYRSRLAEGFDAALFGRAVVEGLEDGIVDVARRVLPGLSSKARLAELERLSAEAQRDGDPEQARRFSAAAFAEAPSVAAHYAAACRLFDRRAFPEARIEVLLLRRPSLMPTSEFEALHAELAELLDEAGYPLAAAEAYLSMLRMPRPQNSTELLSSIDQLSSEADARLVWARALTAASARPEIDDAARRAMRVDLAKVLEDELGDTASAIALRAELALSTPPAPANDPLDPGVGSPTGPPSIDVVFDAGPHAIRGAWERGDLSSAVRMLESADLPPPVAHALWREVAELADVLGQDELARIAFIEAAERAHDAGDRDAALAGRARVAERTGAKREAAEALVGSASARIAGRAHLMARDVTSARSAFGRALDQDPTDVDAAAELVRLYAEDGNHRAVDQLADAMASHPMSDDRRAVWLTELASALHRFGDHAGARRDFVKAIRLDVANIPAAKGLVALAADAEEPAWMDEGLSSLRARWAAQGDWNRAFVAAAVLVGRDRATAADRLTYESQRARFVVTPQASLPPGWVGRWLGLVSVSGRPAGAVASGGRPWQPESGLAEVVGAVQALFRAPEPHWFEDDGQGIRVGAGPVLVVGRTVPRWRRRWRFEVGRALSALVEPKLAGGLEGTAGPPSPEQQVVDRAGLVAAGDPAVALAAIGAHEPRGWRLVPFAISDALISMWRSVGMGIAESGARAWPHRPSVM